MKEDTTMTENGVRRHLPPETKFEMVKEVIMGKAPVSEVCKKQ
jgi:transposase-like protein